MLKPGFVADNRGGARPRWPRAPAAAPPSSASSTPTATCYNAAAVCADGEVVGIYRKRLLPNYAVFDEERYFTPGTRPTRSSCTSSAASRSGVSICEDVWSPDGPIADAGRRRRRADRQHQRLAVPPRARPATASGCSPPGPPTRTLRARLRQPGRRPGRAGLRRRLAGVRRRRRRCSPAARSSSRSCSSSTSTIAAGVPQAPARPARPRVTEAPLPTVDDRRRPGRATSARRRHAAGRRRSTRSPRSTRRSCSAPATTSPRTASPTS